MTTLPILRRESFFFLNRRSFSSLQSKSLSHDVVRKAPGGVFVLEGFESVFLFVLKVLCALLNLRNFLQEEGYDVMTLSVQHNNKKKKKKNVKLSSPFLALCSEQLKQKK